MKRTLFGLSLTLFSSFATAQTSLQLIRSATVVLHYNGQKVLVDPMLSEIGLLPSFAQVAKNPTVSLKLPVADITSSLDLVLVTHVHPDHFDKAASDALSKSIPLFHQPADEAHFRNEGFQHAHSIQDRTEWKGIEIIRTEAQHGSGSVLQYTGNASGFVLRAKGQPTIYIVGDGIWNETVKRNIEIHQPDYIIVNAGGAHLPALKSGPIIMDAEQTIALMGVSGKAKVIAVHMEALDHCIITRSDLRRQATAAGITSDRLLIPEDGETIRL